MDTPGFPEVPDREDPEGRVIDISEFSQGSEAGETLPANYPDNRFAAIQLSEWGHPRLANKPIIEIIMTAACVELPYEDGDIPESDESWDQRLSRLVQKDAYRLTKFDRVDPYFLIIIKSFATATPRQIDAIEIIRRLHVMTQFNELDPLEPSPHVPAILRRILDDTSSY